MSKKQKPLAEFRYYRMPDGSPILALLGQKWMRFYEGEDNLHFHNCLEIGYCYEGQGEIALKEQHFRFSGRQFTVIPPNYPHSTNNDSGTVSKWEYLFVDMECFYCQQNGGVHDRRQDYLVGRINSRAIFKHVEEAPVIAGMILQLLDVMRHAEEFYMDEAMGILAALLVHIARENRPGEWSRGNLPGQFAIPISRALDYISIHYAESLKVQDLAKWCYMSETHFRRMFSVYMKMSPLEYINLIRIQNACNYLRKTDDSISDIAHKCGFATMSTFNRNFRQVMGDAPREWRNRIENIDVQREERDNDV